MKVRATVRGRPSRLTARSRLALLHTGLVVAAGVVLIALTYVLVHRSMAGRRTIIGYQFLPGSTPDVPLPEDPQAAEIRDRLRDETLRELLTQSAVALAVVALLAAALSWWVAGRILRPIGAVSSTARRLSAENLSERVPVSTPNDELAALAVTVNTMLDRIQSGVVDRDRLLRGQRMFVANAAHELRTPLTTMRTAVDVTLDGTPSRDELLSMAADISDAIEHSRRTLDGLLTLARSQALPGDPTPVDLADVVADLVDTVGSRAADRRITLRTDLRAAPVRGESVLLERMVGNLLDNAVRHNRAEGRVTVAVGTDGDDAYVTIANTGRPVESDSVETLFEPFVRGPADDPSGRAEGLGLGLSIVRAVAVAHGGEVSGSARPTGGLDISVRIPASRP